uniref:WAP domain-containing protein n=1 Tax=Syphacia muris TaxID=451379 RepID=A0A0N5AW22_9BILA
MASLLSTIAVSFLLVLSSKVSVARKHGLEWCGYWELIGKLDEHPECARRVPLAETSSTTESPYPNTCSINAALIQCSADPELCPMSGQVCIQSNGERCCQAATKGIPVSEINAKSGSCPQPLGITSSQDTTIGCWLDSGCPGIQKCCVEPNPVTNSAIRICRDPVGISSKNSEYS